MSIKEKIKIYIKNTPLYRKLHPLYQLQNYIKKADQLDFFVDNYNPRMISHVGGV